MSKQKKFAWLSLLMAGTMALSGCGSISITPVDESSKEVPPVTSEEESQSEESSVAEESSEPEYPAGLPAEIQQIQAAYQVILDDRYYMDENGKQIGADQIERGYLKDQITDENRYAVCSMTVDNGKGSMTTYHRVYSLKNELLIDWTTDTVKGGFGNLIIRAVNDGTQATDLINPVNGDVIIEGAAKLDVLTEDRILVTDAGNRILGVVDAAGKIQSGFPMAEDVMHSAAAKGYFFGDLLDEQAEGGVVRILYDAEGNEILRDDQGRNPIIGFYSIVGDYAVMNDTETEGRVVVDLHTLEEVLHYASDADLNYFDGDRMLVRYGEGFYLYDNEGNELNGYFQNYFVASVDSMGIKSKADSFYILDDSWMTKQDYDGNWELDYHTEGLAEAYAESGWIIILVKDGEEMSWGLLNPNLEEIVAPGTYSYFSMRWNDGEHTIWEARYQVEDSMKIALLDETGAVLLENIDAVGNVGKDGIAIIVDGNIGVLHMDGSIDLAAIK